MGESAHVFLVKRKRSSLDRSTCPTNFAFKALLHLNHLGEPGSDLDHFVKRATGRYYTGELVGRRLALQVATRFNRGHPTAHSVSVIDPFGGDGRLIEWLIEAWIVSEFDDVQWDITIWDIDDVGFEKALNRLQGLTTRYGICQKCTFKALDAFAEAVKMNSAFDMALTNPPWELLKPDRRELKSLAITRRAAYISKMHSYDKWLAEHYPLSQPRKKFAGWGTNLSRVGLEASLSLVREGGVVGAVLPASFLADDQTARLRAHLLTKHTVHSAAYYPAEAKLYGSADVASIAVSLTVNGAPASSLIVGTHNIANGKLEQCSINLDQNVLRKIEFVLPISFGAKSLTLINRLAQLFPTWLDLESGAGGRLWAGREIDETGIAHFLRSSDTHAPFFVKGRMISRYKLLEAPTQKVVKPNWSPPPSIKARRIAWRDVSRPSQKRRMIASLIEPGWVAGNSLGVAYFKDFSETPLLALLGMMNSTPFEFQLRAHLATGHVSLSSLRKVAVPSLVQLRQEKQLAALVNEVLGGNQAAAPRVDAYVAKNVYRLRAEEYEIILGSFMINDSERLEYIKSFQEMHGPPLP